MLELITVCLYFMSHLQCTDSVRACNEQFSFRYILICNPLRRFSHEEMII